MRNASLPLNALRVFDAVARHLSFAKAATELGVSQAAVSSQIRGLEKRLGEQLFLRKTRAIELTDKGARLHWNTRNVFQELAEAITDLGRGTSEPLVIALTPSFAARWLFPRLGEYRALHPDTDLRLEASIDLHEFVGTEADLAIRWGKGSWRGLNAEFIMDAPLTPVCSPELAREGRGLTSPTDLASHPLLHERDSYDWRMWLREAGAEHIDAERGHVFGSPSLLDSAAIAGDGVAMGRPKLLGHFLGKGLLVQPFGIYFQTTSAYYLVYREGALTNPRIKAFRDFIMTKCADGGTPPH